MGGKRWGRARGERLGKQICIWRDATEQAGRQGSTSMFGHRWDEEAKEGNEVGNDRERHVLGGGREEEQFRDDPPSEFAMNA